MSSFKGIISEIPQIAIDFFEEDVYNVEAYFVSHIHTDHTKGISNDKFVNNLKVENKRIYTSEATALMLKRKFNKLTPYLHPLDLKKPTIISFRNTQTICVKLLPSGHCIGSVMFLFETNEKRILYTGDIRMEEMEISKILNLHNSLGYPKQIDVLYFDSTFFDKNYFKFPVRKECTKKICEIIKDWIEKDSQNVVFIKQPAHFGIENLIIEINKCLKTKLFVNQFHYERLYEYFPEMDDTFTFDSKASRIFCYFKEKELNDIIKCLNKNKSLNIIPSALYWTNSVFKNIGVNELIEKNGKTIRICYSNHCSFNELVQIIKYLRPKRITPCVLPKEEDKKYEMEKLIENYNCKRIIENAKIQVDAEIKVDQEQSGIFNFCTSRNNRRVSYDDNLLNFD